VPARREGAMDLEDQIKKYEEELAAGLDNEDTLNLDMLENSQELLQGPSAKLTEVFGKEISFGLNS
jgi:hypothetical protein